MLCQCGIRVPNTESAHQDDQAVDADSGMLQERHVRGAGGAFVACFIFEGGKCYSILLAIHSSLTVSRNDEDGRDPEH